MTIGALAAATGVAVETIRTWERRYGYPVATRKPSGHRLYPVSTIPRLRRIAQAIARGHRPAEVVPASEAVLEALLAASGAPAAPRMPRRPAPSHVDLFDAVTTFDTDRLLQSFQFDWARMGALEFLEQRAVPFLGMIGEGWATGTLDIRHEHVASASLGDFLRSVRSPLEKQASGPEMLLATLDGERHGLGLQMSALVVALAGWRALVVGVDTPVAQLAAIVSERPVAAVGISCVQPRDDLNTVLTELRHALPAAVPIVVGGASAPERTPHPGVFVLPDFHALDAWLRERVAG